MNTLLGEIATLNDVQYPVYRVAFKFRKLQRAFLMEYIEATTLQESLHQAGIQGLGRKDPVPLSQLRSFITELYSSLKVQRPSLGASKLQQAQELFFNWCQMVYLTSTGGHIQSGSLKILLCLLSGTKPFDKARILFSVLSNQGGTVESSGLAYFCEATQEIGDSMQENLYTKWSQENMFHDCLAAVRSAEDIEDEEELEGGVKRHWLSQFEFTKMLTAPQTPQFLAWMTLYHKLPVIEKEVHSVRCCECTRKPIVGIRYQGTQRSNYNLCMMCFLKGRTTEDSHQMMEYTTGGKGHKGWKQRLMGSKYNEGKLFTEKKEPFVYSPRTSTASRTSPTGNEHIDTPLSSITHMLSHTQQNSGQKFNTIPRTHLPAMIRISSNESNKPNQPHSTSQPVNGRSATKPMKAFKGGSPKRTSFSSSGGSPDSVSSSGKFNYDNGSDLVWQHSSVNTLSMGSGSPTHEGMEPQVGRRDSRKSSVNSAHNLEEINQRLSMEVDQLLSELPPPSSQPKLKLNSDNISKLQLEEYSLKGQVNTLTGKRTKLTGDLNGLLSQLQKMQLEGNNASLERASYLIPSHARADSAPIHTYPHSVGSSLPPSPQRHAAIKSPEVHKSLDLLDESQHLLDPLVDFTPEQLNIVSPAEQNRMSVAW